MIGTQIAGYRILEKLGEGGMGVVYKAVDTDLDRLAAMKVLGADFSKNPELVERFRAEAKAQANLNHTNLATLYAFLFHDGTAFMVMEFVDGETFEQMIRRRGPIPEQEAIPLFRQALLGIGYAHRAGIIHRDIKPSNLMLNRSGIVKVMDFGIAKVMGSRGMTRTGTQMGTVAYMSPEQIQNRAVDIRSDIYELGVTLYEMLTGHLPFESDSDFEVMQDHVAKAPPPPTRFYPYISKGVERVVLKALDKNPDARFQTVEEFGAALEHPDSFTYNVSELAPQPPVVPPRGTVPQPGPPVHVSPPMYAPGNLPPTVPVTIPAGGFTQPTVPAGMPPRTLPMVAKPSAPFWAQKKWIIVGVGVLLALVIAVAIYQMNAPVPSGGGEASGGGGGGGGGSETRHDSPVKPPPEPGKTLTIDDGGGSTPLKLGEDTPPPAPRPKPAPLTAAQMYQHAQTALSQHHYFEPINNSALHWAIEARKAGSPEGRALENQMLEVYRNQLNEYLQQRNYQSALALVTAMLRFYPGDSHLLAEQEKLRGAVAGTQRQSLTESSSPAVPQSANSGISGDYLGTVLNSTVNQSAQVELALDQTGDQLRGCVSVHRPLYGSGPVNGSVRGSNVVFVATNSQFNITFTGRKEGAGIKGNYVVNQGGAAVQHGIFEINRRGPVSANGLQTSRCPSD